MKANAITYEERLALWELFANRDQISRGFELPKALGKWFRENDIPITMEFHHPELLRKEIFESDDDLFRSLRHTIVPHLK